VLEGTWSAETNDQPSGPSVPSATDRTPRNAEVSSHVYVVYGAAVPQANDDISGTAQVQDAIRIDTVSF